MFGCRRSVCRQLLLRRRAPILGFEHRRVFVCRQAIQVGVHGSLNGACIGPCLNDVCWSFVLRFGLGRAVLSEAPGCGLAVLLVLTAHFLKVVLLVVMVSV